MSRELYSSYEHGMLFHIGILVAVNMLLCAYILLDKVYSNIIPIGPSFSVLGGGLFIVLLFRSRKSA